MEKPLVVVSAISIDAPLTQVWDALVNPAKTKLYMFGCETVSDWNPGSDLLWRGTYEGKQMDFVKGKIVEFRPPEKLVYTTFDPFSSIDDKPENYLTVTYDLKTGNNESLLTVTQGDFATVADSEKRYKDASNNGEGWNPILVEIKKLVENK